MSVSKKSKLLVAMYAILKEYKNKTHKTSVSVCSLCDLFYDETLNLYDDDGKVNTCNKCPMFVFFNPDSNNPLPCLNRKCEPVNCYLRKNENGKYSKETVTELKRVIKFYESAINKIETMSDRQVRESSFKFLIKIDNNIAEKSIKQKNMKIKKGELIKAMQAVLVEYENNTHKCDLTCPLCRLYFHLNREISCKECLMFVFHPHASLSCLYRKCEPISSNEKNNINKLEAVKEFYKKAITKVKSMSYIEMNKPNAFKFLIKIDKEVAEITGLNKI